jgi:hypothetical protein
MVDEFNKLIPDVAGHELLENAGYIMGRTRLEEKK